MVAGVIAERFGAVGLFRVAEQTDAQFGLFQCLLAAAVKTDAALVGGEGIFQTHLSLFHLLDQMFKRVERLFEVGDRRCGRGSICGSCFCVG